MRIEFVRGSTQTGAFPAASTARLVNMYPERLPEGALAQYILRGVLGKQVFAVVPGLFVRALQSVGDKLFALSGGRLLNVRAQGDVEDIGAIPDDAMTLIRGNAGIVTITAAGRYFTFDGTDIDEVLSAPFNDMGGHDVLGGYTVITEKNGRRFQWSALQDATELPGLNFATAEARDDNIIRPMSINGNLWLLKERTIEIWALTGAPGAEAFARLPGAVIETGLKGFGLAHKIPDGLFMVGSDNRAYIAAGSQLQRVSTPAVEYDLDRAEPTNCFFYEDEGHQFCVVRFRNRPAWVFDLSEGIWHERASGDGEAWDAQLVSQWRSEWYAAGQSGLVWHLCRCNVDDNHPLIRQATSHTAHNNGARFRVPKLEMHGRVGRSPGTLQVRVSRDGGKTWGLWQTRTMGAPGDWDQRMVFRALGQARRFAVQVRVTDPADLSLLSAADLEVA